MMPINNVCLARTVIRSTTDMTYHDPAIEILNVRRGLPKRAPIYGQHREKDDGEEDTYQDEDPDIDLPRCGSRRVV